MKTAITTQDYYIIEHEEDEDPRRIFENMTTAEQESCFCDGEVIQSETLEE